MSEEKSLTLVQRLARVQSKQLSNDPVIARVLSKVAAVAAKGRTLLLDCSGSMLESVGHGSYETKLDALQKIVREFHGTRMFSFGSFCREQGPEEVMGGTNMALAFATVKQAGLNQIVLITDGYPDSESMALHEAQGLKIDIVYIGPPPPPPFLSRLAAVTGGQFGVGNLAEPKQLTQKVQQLLLGVKK